MRTFYGDAQKLLLSLIAGPVTIAVSALAVVGLMAYCAGQRTGKQDLQVAALRDTIRITDSVVQVRTDTVVRVQRRVDTVRAKSDSLDSMVVLVNDSTVQTPDTIVVVPPLLIADIRGLRATVATQDTLITALYQRDTTRQWQIATRDKMIRELTKRKLCGSRCYLALGFTAGLLIHKAVR